MLKIRFVFLFILFSVLNTSFAQDQTVGLFTNDSRSFNGYTLFDPMRSTTAFLIDNCGNTVNTWTSTLRPNLATYLLEDGSLLRACRITTAGGRLEKLDWDGNVIWSYEFDSQFFDMHHDIEPLPNGNILIISHDIYTPEEAILEGRDSTLLETELQSEKIVEIQPVGTDTINIVWEWKAWDHLIQDYDPLMNNYGVVADHPELFNINYFAALGAAAKTDWLHYNGIDYNPDLDQILLCSRNLSEIQVIDHSTTTAEAAGHTGGLYGKGGDILYRFGNPISYDRGIADDRLLFFQHDAQWVPAGYPDEGKMLVFNNQVSDTTSSVVILDPPMDSAGYYSDPGIASFGPADFVWAYESTEIYASNISGTQQMPNGNILICRGVEGNFFEMDKDGNLLWKYVNPVGNIGPVSQGMVPAQSNVFKIRRYAPDFPGFNGKDLTPGAPVELDPWPSTCLVLEDTIAHFDLKVFLQGPFNGTTMDEELNNMGAIPLAQPYNTPPWNYKGTESVNQLPDVNIVDWLLIEYRDTTNASSANSSTIISRQAAFLLTDGSIVGMDGSAKLKFYNTINHEVYIAAWHRNHLGILSAFPVTESGGYLTYDFSTSENQVYNDALGHVEISPGIWGMMAGDANQDQVINDDDLISNWKIQAGYKGYLPTDFNLDLQIENRDKNNYWLLNKDKFSQVP